jgi:hypothetical protein
MEILDNHNSLVWWKFNKTALQMELREDSVYQLKISGWYGLRSLIDIEVTP